MHWVQRMAHVSLLLVYLCQCQRSVNTVYTFAQWKIRILFFMKLVSVPLKKGGPRIVIARMHISVRNAIIFPGKLCHTNECCQLNKHTRSDHV